MLPSQVTIEVRDSNLSRVGQITSKYWNSVKVVARLRRQGEWSLSLPYEHPLTDALRAPGSGIIITGPYGVILSGPCGSSERTQKTADVRGMVEFRGCDDNVLLADYVAYPDPAHDASAQTAAYDKRTGPGESIIRAYVNANLGPGALASRRVGLLAEKLTLAADGGRGAVATGTARFDQLGPFLDALGKVSGVGYRIVQAGDDLLLEFWEPQDKTKLIRFDIENGRLTQVRAGIAAPTVTDAIVLGQGEGAGRQIIERTSVDAAAARAAWGRRIEVVKDQRNTDVVGELEQAGDELLVDGGRTRAANSLTLTDDLSMLFQRDWNLGDIVTVVVGGVEVPEVVTAVGLGISSSGVVIGAKVGES